MFSSWPYAIDILYAYGTVQPICAENAIKHQPINLLRLTGKTCLRNDQQCVDESVMAAEGHPLLFSIVVKMISREFWVSLPWKLLYLDDLMMIAECREQVIRKFNIWKEGLE